MLKRLACCAALWILLVPATFTIAQVPFGPGDWPQFHGPRRDSISRETGLMKQWPKDGPKIAWQVDSVGGGFSSIAIKDGRIFTQGDLDGVEHIIALAVDDGRLLWAVQPAPVAIRLRRQVSEDMKQIDNNGDGQVDEVEALARFGWDFNKYDRPTDGDTKTIATQRAQRLFELLDGDGDGRLTAAEMGKGFLAELPQIDVPDNRADVKKLARARTQAFLKALDSDGDDTISQLESRGSLLEGPFQRIDQKDPATNKGDGQLTAKEIETDLVKFEAGKDGQIELQELGAFYARRYPLRDGKITGPELRRAFGGMRNVNGDGPRSTPTVDGDRVYTEGGRGDLTCLDAATGQTLWHVNLVTDIGGVLPNSGYSESPLIEGDLIVVTPGDKLGTVAALDKHTGKVVWRSDELTEGTKYCSPVAATIGGIRQIVHFAQATTFGVSADRGRLLWQYDGAANAQANVSTPVVDGDYVFASSGYGTGGGLVKIVADGDRQKAEEVYFAKKMSNHHGGIVKVRDHMYGFGTGGLIAMDYLSGKIAWRNRSVTKGSLVVADDMLYLLGENHQVALADATPEAYRERGRFSIPSYGHRSWSHPVVAGGRLYIRNQHMLTAYDVTAP